MFSPSVVTPPVLPTTPQPFIGGAPTITDFPSPPFGPASNISNTNNSSSIGGSTNIYTDNGFQSSMGSTNNTWNQPTPGPNLDQSQNFYNSAGSPPVYSSHQPPSNYIGPAAPSPGPSSGYMPITPNPAPPTSNLSNVQYGYGTNNNNNNNLYQSPIVPSPAPAPSVPMQPPYGQPSYNTPSAPFQQPLPTPSSQPYAPIPMVLDPDVNNQVQKHCKWTISALTYDDVPAAIDNLEKALALLRVSTVYFFDLLIRRMRTCH